MQFSNLLHFQSLFFISLRCAIPPSFCQEKGSVCSKETDMFRLASSHGLLNVENFGLTYKLQRYWVARGGFFWLIRNNTITNEIVSMQVIYIDIFITTCIPDPGDMELCFECYPLGTKIKSCVVDQTRHSSIFAQFSFT